MKILVTGAKGVVGRNLVAQLKNIRDGKARCYGDLAVSRIYEYDVDSTQEQLDEWCSDCDFVFNLAGVNRPQNQEEFMQGNCGFAGMLLDMLKKHGNKCPVMISSSIQATLAGRFGTSEYGRSKKAGEELVFDYGRQTGVKVLVYRFPNLFGKWCRPNYNSAIATFCNNIANDLPIQVNDRNVEMELLYIDDLVDEIKERVARGERALVTTLTVRMAEDLTAYLKEMDLKVAWLHHEVKTIERTEIIHDLRQGKYDVLVGINLLREGLDIPEVSLIAILDADKEGFLRSKRSLIQIIGRAARNAEGKVILYADTITESMRYAIDETNRRRQIQIAYNEKHGIVPKTIIKPIHDVVRSKETKEMAARYLKKKKMPAKQKEVLLENIQKEMREAARTLDFERAAQLRDILFELKEKD